MSYKVSDLIDKSLVAKVNVPVTRIAQDGAESVFTVKPGQSVGVVYSWVEPTSGRSNLWFMFKDSNNRSYFAENIAGRFDVSVLQGQGVKTSEQKTKEQERANESLSDKIERNLKTIILIGAATYLGGKYITKK